MVLPAGMVAARFRPRVVIAALIVYAIYRAVQFRKYKMYRVVPRVQVEELARILASDEKQQILLADVRSHGYYDADAERIRGSIRLEPNNLSEELKTLPKEKNIYLYCT